MSVSGKLARRSAEAARGPAEIWEAGDGQTRLRNDAVARWLYCRRAGRPGTAGARPRAPSPFQRPCPRTRRLSLWPPHLRDDAVLGRGSSGMGRDRARFRAGVAGAAEMGGVAFIEVG